MWAGISSGRRVRSTGFAPIARSTAWLGLAVTAGCATAQTGVLLDVRTAFERTDFNHCISRAEAGIVYGEHDLAISAELHFYKALCLEGARRIPEAVLLYHRVMERYPSTDFALQAAARLKDLQSPP